MIIHINVELEVKVKIKDVELEAETIDCGEHNGDKRETLLKSKFNNMKMVKEKIDLYLLKLAEGVQ